MKHKGHSIIFSKNSYVYFIIALTLYTFFTKMLAGAAYYNQVDLINFNLSWLDSLRDGLFDVYARNPSIDYPPVFLILLYPFAGLLNIPVVADDRHLIMIILKAVPVLFDCLIIPLIWMIFKNRSHKAGLIAASLWAVNCSAAVNSTLWGQTDTIMAFMLILSFYLLDSGRAVWGGVVFGLACVTKFQSLYFAPVVFMELVTKYNIKKVLSSIGAGIACGAAIFLPFMIGSHNVWLVPDLYFGGFGKYNYATLNAANFYAMMGLNGVQTDYSFANGSFGAFAPFLQHINIGVFGTIMLALAIIGMVALYVTAKNRSVWVFSILFMQCIFMMTTKMHERYQFIVVPLCLVFAYLADDLRFLAAYAMLSITTGINQFILLMGYNNSVESFWYLSFGKILSATAVVNMIAFIYTIYICIDYCYRDRTKRTVSDLSQYMDDQSDAVPEPDAAS